MDLSNRMQDITTTLTSSPTTDTDLHEREQLLDELMEIVENIDQAKDLSTIGGLPTLLSLLTNPAHPSLQWRAAEVVAACAQNNPEVQDAFLREGVLPAVWPLLDININGDGSSSTTTRTPPASDLLSCQIKGLLAMSCQLRGHPQSLEWFRSKGGVQRLIQIAETAVDSRLQRKCLQLLQHVLCAAPADKQAACAPLLPLLTKLIVEASDADVRGGALQVVQSLADGDDDCLGVMQGDEALVSAVQAVQVKLDALPEEDWGAAEDEAAVAMAVMIQLTRKKGGGGGVTALSSSPVEEEEEEGDAVDAVASSMQVLMLPPPSSDRLN